jgi:hypothetical protein
MAEHWIEARDAARVIDNIDTLRERLAAGLVRFRARRVMIDGEIIENVQVPDEFWSDDGRERLQQDWNTGDFVSSFDGLTQSRAFGVQFHASDILDMVPSDQRAAAARSLSVAGNPAWVSAREARRFAYDTAGHQPLTAGKAVIEQSRLGFITARAVEMRWASGNNPGRWTTEVREWDVPTWFWEDFTAENSSTQSWEQGLFAGRGRGPQGYGWITLNGVYFLRSSLDVLLPAAHFLDAGQEALDKRKPDLPEAELRRWWDRLSGARDVLTQEQLRALATNDHPQHSISRERIRALADGRKPGPKSS